MATKTISQFPAATTPANADITHIRQSNVDKNLTLNLLAEFVIKNSDFADDILTISSSQTISQLSVNTKVIVDASVGDITLGIYNGASVNGVVLNISSTGSNTTTVDFTNSTTKQLILNEGQSVTVIWDDNTSAWVVLSNTVASQTVLVDSASTTTFTLDMDNYPSSSRIFLDGETTTAVITFTIDDVPAANFEQNPEIMITNLGTTNNVEIVATGIGGIGTEYIVIPQGSVTIKWTGSEYQIVAGRLQDALRVIDVGSGTSSVTIPDGDTEVLYRVTTGTQRTTLTLPTASDNLNRIIGVEKVDTGYGPLVLDGEGAETINDWLQAVLFLKDEHIKVQSDGSNWKIINEWKWYFETGWESRSDWENVHIGIIDLVLTDSTGFEQWEVVIESVSGYRGIIAGITGNTLHLWWVDDGSGGVGGFFTNGRTITGGSSSATDTVNGNTKNVDTNIFHGWGLSMKRNVVELYTSITGAESGGPNGLRYTDYATNESTTGTLGYQKEQIDLNSGKIQMCQNGIWIVNDNGTVTQINVEDQYHNEIVRNIK